MPTLRDLLEPAPSAGRIRTAATASVAALAVLLLDPAGALAAAAKATGDDAPLDLGADGTGGQQVGAGGGGIARVIVGLLVVVAVIYGVTWVLRQVKGAREAPTGTGLHAVTTLPLHGGGALSLVRVGDELLLLGSGANGATTLRRYDEDEARALGLWPDEDDPDGPRGSGTGGPGGGANVATILGKAVRWLRARTPEAVGRGLTTLLERLRAMTVRG